MDNTRVDSHSERIHQRKGAYVITRVEGEQEHGSWLSIGVSSRWRNWYDDAIEKISGLACQGLGNLEFAFLSKLEAELS